MDATNITRPENLPFNVPEQLASDINVLIEGLIRGNDPLLDCYLNEVMGSARMLPEKYDMQVRKYYCYGEWQHGGFND